MKLRIHLAAADRERYGCDEWLEYDWDTISFAEAIVLQGGLQVGGVTVAFDSPAQWRQALLGHPVLVDGQPAMVDLVDESGPVLDPETHEPVRVVKRRADFGALLVAAWVGLRRAGHEPSLAEVAACNLDAVRLDFVTDPAEDDSGKGGSAPGTTS